MYCPIRGVNLQCNGGTECRCNPKTTNTEATYEDPRGGSKQNWVKYRGLCGPDNQYYKTEAEYYAMCGLLLLYNLDTDEDQ